MVCNRYIIFFFSFQKPKLATIEEGGTSGTANVNESNFNISAQAKGNIALNDVVAISELERLMEGKTFSRYVYYHVSTLVAFQVMLDGNSLPFAC